jgi:hypothetical protein
VLDRAFQKPKPKATVAVPHPKPKARRDSVREPWEVQYDQADEPEAVAVEQDVDEEMNLATLLNVLDGSKFLLSVLPCVPLARIARIASIRPVRELRTLPKSELSSSPSIA